MIAKICSDFNKPNGQYYIKPELDTILNFIGDMPIRKIPYIGGMKETTLTAMGFKTGKDLRDRAADLMIAYLEIEHTFLIKCGMGLGQQKHGEEGSMETFE